MFDFIWYKDRPYPANANVSLGVIARAWLRKQLLAPGISCSCQLLALRRELDNPCFEAGNGYNRPIELEHAVTEIRLCTRERPALIYFS